MPQANGRNDQLYWHLWLERRDERAGDLLAKMYLPLVNYHVQRVLVNLPKSVSREDMRSLGLMGLFDALLKFDLSRDLKFETYASFRIRGAILDGLRKEDRLSRSTREKVKLIEAAIEQLEQKKMRNISASEAALELGMTEEEVNVIANEKIFANVWSIDERSKEQNDETHSLGVIDEQAISPEGAVLNKEMLSEVEKHIQSMGRRKSLCLICFTIKS